MKKRLLCTLLVCTMVFSQAVTAGATTVSDNTVESSAEEAAEPVVTEPAESEEQQAVDSDADLEVETVGAIFWNLSGSIEAGQECIAELMIDQNTDYTVEFVEKASQTALLTKRGPSSAASNIVNISIGKDDLQVGDYVVRYWASNDE